MKKLTVFIFAFFVALSVFGQQNPEGLFIKSKAPDFKAKDQQGNEVVLKELRKKGNVVLIFYRGNWCPFCNRQLKNLQDSLQLIYDKGAQLIAVTPEAQDGIDATVTKTGATFPILYDEDMKISTAYEVSFKPQDDLVQRYKRNGTDLLQINHQKKEVSLPVPAVYIINREGDITYRYFDANYRNRVSVKDIINNLK